MNALGVLLSSTIGLGVFCFGAVYLFGNRDPGQVFPLSFQALIAGVMGAGIGLALGIVITLGRFIYRAFL